MERKYFTPEQGTTLENRDGGTFVCLEKLETPGNAVLQNVISGWTFDAHGCGMYDDGSMDWDFSTNGHFIDDDFRKCPVCGRLTGRSCMEWTKDCHGISMRLVCHECWRDIMGKGYDGEYYSFADEQIEANY